MVFKLKVYGVQSEELFNSREEAEDEKEKLERIMDKICTIQEEK